MDTPANHPSTLFFTSSTVGHTTLKLCGGPIMPAHPSQNRRLSLCGLALHATRCLLNQLCQRRRTGDENLL